MNLLDLIRSIFQIKVTGKPRIEEGHYYPAPSYWTWKWNQ